jgi:hypothetical protein
MNFKKMLSGTIIISNLLCGIACAQPIEKNNRAYIIAGASSSSENPIHAGMGMIYYKPLSDDLLIGLELSTLLENTNSEFNFGINLNKEFDNYSIMAGLGLTEIRFDNACINERSSYIKGEIGKRIFDTSKIKFIYTQNLADEKLVENNYPKQRISLGLETSF